jgi:murein DD-endopeptidase MepM/ murein hydrolase activator NlpD
VKLAVLAALCLATPAFAFDVTVAGRLEQGGLIMGSAPPGSTVTFNERTVPVTGSGAFILGIDRDAPASAALVVTASDGTKETRVITVRPRDWKIERVDGVPQKLVTPDPETAALIAADNKLLRAARAQLELTPFYETGLIRPAEGRISGVFGSQRILNGTPGAFHAGLDIAGPIGTPVRAAADGVVSLQRNMVMSGNTVLLNHGYGLQTTYIHMNKINVTDGQRVKQGDAIGEIGMTGRANGPHLHFSVNWFNTRLDPETVLAVLPARLN